MQQSDLMGQLYQQRWELFYVLCSLTQTAKLSYTKTIRLHNFQTYFSENINCLICFPAREAMTSHLTSTSPATEQHNKEQMTYR